MDALLQARYGDAIRSLVTAIKLTVEAKLRAALVARGLTEQEVETRLDQTFNNFKARLSDFSQGTGRRLPGPFVSMLPYLNGLRLKWELDDTRKLRHKIVHEGLRLEQSLKSGLQRPMETMSWLFNWFQGDSPTPVTSRTKKYSLKSGMLGRVAFSCEYSEGGVIVNRHAGSPDTQVWVCDGTAGPLLVKAMDSDPPDIESFAFTCFTRLGFRVVDSAVPETGSPFFHERCFLVDAHTVVVVFLVDTCELVGRTAVEQVATRVLALKQKGRALSSVFCVVNHQSGLSWQLREVESAIPEDVVQLATSCGITLMTTCDLLLLVRGAESYKWDMHSIIASLMKPGRQG